MDVAVLGHMCKRACVYVGIGKTVKTHCCVQCDFKYDKCEPQRDPGRGVCVLLYNKHQRHSLHSNLKVLERRPTNIRGDRSEGNTRECHWEDKMTLK